MSLKTFRLRVDDDGTDRDLVMSNGDIVLSDNLDDKTGVSRRSLDTEIILTKSSYDTFKTISDAVSGCGTLDAEIRAGTSLATLMYAAKIKLQSTKISWDEDLCKIELNLDSDDDYTSFFDQWEIEFNAFDGVTLHDIRTNTDTTRTQDCEEFGVFADRPSNTVDLLSNCLENPLSWGTLQYTFAFINPQDDWRRFTRWGRSEISGVSPGGDWVSVGSETPDVADLARPIFTKGVLNNEEAQEFEIVNGFENGILLNDLIETFLPTGYTVRSNFFGLNASGTVPQNDAYQTASSNCQSIMVFRKDDIRNYNVNESQQDINEVLTYKELTEMLKNQFNVEFRITGTEVRFEHVSYFEEKAQGTDITAIKSGIFTKGRNKWDYDNSKVARKETWSFMEEVSAQFKGKTIYYPCATSDDTEEINYNLSKVNNDIQLIVSRPDSVSSEGFVFVHASLFNSEYYLNYGSTIDQSALLPNYFMSLPSLIRNFHYYQRPFSSGDIDEVTVNFISSVRRRNQPSITFPISRADYLNFNPDELMRSGLGWGEVRSATYSEKEGTLTVNLRHV